MALCRLNRAYSVFITANQRSHPVTLWTKPRPTIAQSRAYYKSQLKHNLSLKVYKSIHYICLKVNSSEHCNKTSITSLTSESEKCRTSI